MKWFIYNQEIYNFSYVKSMCILDKHAIYITLVESQRFTILFSNKKRMSKSWISIMCFLENDEKVLNLDKMER
jgi:hypothetical protein